MTTRLVDAMSKIMQSRPMTLVHGDLNCGNVWKNKNNPMGELLFSDWQILQMCPAVLDFGTMLVMLPRGPTRAETLQLMKTYHDGLPMDMQEEYTLEQFHQDYRMFVLLMVVLLPTFLAGQVDPSSMAAEKHKFTWSQFWPPIYRRLLQLYKEESLEELASHLQDAPNASVTEQVDHVEMQVEKLEGRAEQVDHVELQVAEVNQPLCITNVFYTDPAECKTQQYCQSPDDITNKWLSDALNATVLSHAKTLCGQGQLGLTVLVTDIAYADGTEARPPSVAIKMHTQTEASLLFVQQLNSYSRELFFYTAFSREFPLKYPKVLGVWTDPNGADLKGEPVLGFNLIMDNLCDEWQVFDPATNPPTLEEIERMILSLRAVHVKFWKKGSVITQRPLSDTGAKWSFYEKLKPMVAMLPQVWPTVRSAFPKLAGWGTEFPHEFDEMIDFVDRFAANMDMTTRLMDAMSKIVQSRPMTLVHGDLNCGNVWKNKNNPMGEFLFSDWQILQMSPAAYDFGTMLVILPHGPTRAETLQLMKTHHDGLPMDMQEEYTLEQFHEDYRMFVLLMVVLLPTFLAGQVDPSSMDAEKHKFTWTQFWPPIYRRLLQLYKEESLEELASHLLDAPNASVTEQVDQVEMQVEKLEGHVDEQVHHVEMQVAQVEDDRTSLCITNVFYPDPAECKAQQYCQSPDDVTNNWLSDALNATVLSHA